MADKKITKKQAAEAWAVLDKLAEMITNQKDLDRAGAAYNIVSSFFGSNVRVDRGQTVAIIKGGNIIPRKEKQ